MTPLKCLVFLASCLPLAAGIADTYKQLQQLDPADASFPQIVPLMNVYKAQLRALTAATLATEANQRRLQSALEEALRREGVAVAAIDDSVDRRPYGQIFKVEVLCPAEQPALLAVTYHLRLQASLDSSLTLYRNGQPIFQSDADSIETPQFTTSDGGGNFLMLLSALGAVSANGSYALTVELFRGSAKDPPRRLSRQEFNPKRHQVAIDADGYRLELLAPNPVLMGCCEVFPLRFTIHGDRLARIQPLGFTPNGFLDALLPLPAAELAVFAEPAVRGKLHGVAERLAGQRPITGRCDDFAKLWQLSYPGGPYFLVERTGTWHFRLRDVRTEPLPNCQPDEQYPWRATMFEQPLER